jgi:hypothetical protein
MARRKCRTRRKRRSGGAESLDPAPYPAAVMAEGRQPSNEIMEWATTAGIPAPLNMQNVAHGGKRSTKRITRRKRHGKRSTKHHGKRHTKRSKRSTKRSMRSRKRRGGDCGCAIRP